jgi:hypothetical protein
MGSLTMSASSVTVFHHSPPRNACACVAWVCQSSLKTAIPIKIAAAKTGRVSCGSDKSKKWHVSHRPQLAAARLRPRTLIRSTQSHRRTLMRPKC